MVDLSTCQLPFSRNFRDISKNKMRSKNRYQRKASTSGLAKRAVSLPKPGTPARGLGLRGSDCAEGHERAHSPLCCPLLSSSGPDRAGWRVSVSPAKPPSPTFMQPRFRVVWPGKGQLRLNELGPWPGDHRFLSEHSKLPINDTLLIPKIFL